MNSAISTSIKYKAKNISEKLSSHKKIKITTNINRTVKYISSASYFEIYF